MSVDNEGCSDVVSLPQVFDVRLKARQEFRESRAYGGLAGYKARKAADRGMVSRSGVCISTCASVRDSVAVQSLDCCFSLRPCAPVQ
jgi:hypothetical protein